VVRREVFAQMVHSHWVVLRPVSIALRTMSVQVVKPSTGVPSSFTHWTVSESASLVQMVKIVRTLRPHLAPTSRVLAHLSPTIQSIVKQAISHSRSI